MPPSSSSVVLAAGTIVWRERGRGIEVLVIHRRRRMDWSLPKGKVERGESLPVTAVRETLEETTVAVSLGVPVAAISYQSLGLVKEVHYWLATPTDPLVAAGRLNHDPVWQPNDEVDQVVWLRPRAALAKLTYSQDVEVLRKALDQLRPTSPLVLLRHAEAEKRAAFANRHKGKPPHDHERPLTADGEAERPAIAAALRAFGVKSSFSSPARRCVDTVAGEFAPKPAVVQVPEISEFGFVEDAGRAAEKSVALSRVASPLVVVCHRPVLPTMVEAIAEEFGVTPPNPRLKPGQYLVLHRPLDRSGRISTKTLVWEFSGDLEGR